MEGTILSHRRGVNTQHNTQYIIEVNDDGFKTKEKTQTLIGKKVVFKTISNKKIEGKILSTHGNKGAVRTSFEKGLPGEALGKKVEII